MGAEKVSDRGLATHIVLQVEPNPDRPLVLKFEMNDDGCQSPGITVSRALLAAYPAAQLEILLLDLLSLTVLSEQYGASCGFIDSEKVPGLDKLRERLVKLAGYWQQERGRIIEQHACYQKTE